MDQGQNVRRSTLRTEGQSQRSPESGLETAAEELRNLCEGWRPSDGDVAAAFIDESLDEPPVRAKLVGPYLVSNRLGSGSYATVKECIDVRSLRRFAVKILSYRKGRKIPTFEQDVKSEIRLLKRLHHPNVIELFDVLEKRKLDNLKQYFVLTYCIADMQHILEFARGHKFPEYQAQRYLRQTCDGLEYLHSIGVIHKDIKPGNLLIAPDDTVRITDFGVAELLGEFAPDDQIKRSAGTVAFQPPEVFNSDENSFYPGYKLDIWSLGVTLYSVTSGALPYTVNSDPGALFRLMAVIEKSDWQLPEGLSVSLGDLITHMMDRNVSTRFSMAQIRCSEWFVADLERVGDYVNPNIGTLRNGSTSLIDMFNEPDGSSTVKCNALDTTCRMTALRLGEQSGVRTGAELESKSQLTASSIDTNNSNTNSCSVSLRKVLTDEEIEERLYVSDKKTKQLYAHMVIKDDDLDEETEALSFTIRASSLPEDEREDEDEYDGSVGSSLENDYGRRTNAVAADLNFRDDDSLPSVKRSSRDHEVTEAPVLQAQNDDSVFKKIKEASSSFLPFCKIS